MQCSFDGLQEPVGGRRRRGDILPRKNHHRQAIRQRLSGAERAQNELVDSVGPGQAYQYRYEAWALPEAPRPLPPFSATQEAAPNASPLPHRLSRYFR
jgi:hypothetical protein